MDSDCEGLVVSAPGRICLFGEHQDYLHLPVIPCAISLRIAVTGMRRERRRVLLKLPDIGATDSFLLQKEVPYTRERDYFRSAMNVLQRKGYTFARGFDCTVRGNIPINSGTSSSSALIVAWITFLARMSDQEMDLAPEKVAVYAHEAEVVEFSEPGGMMDHYSTALGGILYLDFQPRTEFEKINAPLKSFILGDSGEPKDTKHILARVKNQVVSVTGALARKYPGFSLRELSLTDLERYAGDLSGEQKELLEGTIRNFQITRRARKILKDSPLAHETIGKLLNDHQTVLRDALKISTKKIDRMIEAALCAGAYGAKINGSGGGGCMFAYAPEKPRNVLEAIHRLGCKGYIVQVGQGVRLDAMEE